MNNGDHLLDLCRRHLDPDASPLRLHPGHAGTTVLRARTARHGDVIIKTHRDRQRHDQETHAYRIWVPALRHRAPTPLAVVDHPPSIIVTAASGRPLSERRLGPTAKQEAHRRAGEILRLLHTAGPPRTDPDWTVWLAQRADYWLHQAGARVTARRRADVRAHMRALQDLAPIPTVPCHLDYTPQNLIHADDGRVRAIDFEHSRYDLAARDLVRFATRIWPHRADLRDSFLHGYGDLTSVDEGVIEHCGHLDALTALARSDPAGSLVGTQSSRIDQCAPAPRVTLTSRSSVYRR